MRTGNLKKYIVPNIPYLFIGWAFLKVGTAYRLAAGADFLSKVMGIGQTIGVAFADFAPGLNPVDWLVGIVGAVAFRLFIHMKSKNAKKFRRDAEYGSARWGNEKDIRPFVDPKFENNVILTGTEFLTMNTRPKIPANARNLNCCVIGSSGSGKTRFWLTPQLLQAHSSFVVVDPKGGVLSQVGHFLQKRRGYKIKVFNSIDFSKSMHYNPLAYIKNEADILKTENILVFYQKAPAYFPQFTYGEPYSKVHARSGTSPNYGKFERQGSESSDGRRYPSNVLFVQTVAHTMHPTQKPVELCEYLIKTYTREGEVVADICAGSGTTAIAALNTGRRFVCFETAPAIYGPAAQRIEQARLAVGRGEKGV